MRAWVSAGLVIATVAVVGLAVYYAEEPPPAPPPVPVELVRADFAALDRAVSEQKGSVVLVDCWATTCPPCRDKFPQLVALHKRYAKDGLVCISVCYDPEPQDRAAALRMLREWRATFRNYHFPGRTRADQERMHERFAVAGYLPHAVLFDRSGQRVWDSSSSPAGEDALEQLIYDNLATK